VTACNCPQKHPDHACPRAKSSRQSGQQRQMPDVHRYWAGAVSPLKGHNLENFCTLLSLDITFNIRGHGENTPYSSSEPNESDIADRHIGGRD